MDPGLGAGVLTGCLYESLPGPGKPLTVLWQEAVLQVGVLVGEHVPHDVGLDGQGHDGELAGRAQGRAGQEAVHRWPCWLACGADGAGLGRLAGVRELAGDRGQDVDRRWPLRLSCRSAGRLGRDREVIGSKGQDAPTIMTAVNELPGHERALADDDLLVLSALIQRCLKADG